MTFEEWWEIYTPPVYSPLDSYEMEKAFNAGFEAGKESLTEPVSSVIEQEHNGMEIVGD